jgi:2-dehydropantoate 2-reductase
MDDMKDDNILIVGTGALACLFAARLAPHSEVTMIGTWLEGIQALQKHGVRILDEGGERAYPVRALSDPDQCPENDSALVLVKSWQTIRAAKQLSQCLHRKGIAGPGKVKPGGKGPIHVVPQPKLHSLLGQLKKAEFEVKESDDLDSLIWGKLVINAGINPITALLQIPNGALLEQPDAHALMEAAALEAAAVAEASGVRLPYDDPVKRVEEVAEQTAPNHSSMFQDVQRGAPTEIEAISGAVVKEGERFGVPTPVNRVLLHLIRAMVSEELRGPE